MIVYNDIKRQFVNDVKDNSIADKILEAIKMRGLNAGHDLSLENLAYLKQQIPWMDEVSIGHALVCDALYLGLKKTIEDYKNCLK